MRALSPVAIALTLGVVLGGAGLADAATGGNFILGKINHETSEASLNSSKGTPLSLSAPGNHAPLSVNQRVMVKNLNAQFVGGQSASALQSNGGDGFTLPGTDTALTSTFSEVVSTGELQAGTYYVTGTALIDTNSSWGFCVLVKASATGTALAWGGEYISAGYVTASETLAVKMAKFDELQEWCEVGTTGFAYNAGVTAIRISSSSGTAPAVAGRAHRPAP
jgi:hypothetical protein